MRPILLLAALALILPAALAANAPPTPAPALVVQTLDHGRFDLAAERGRWILVNFWATWCAPCLKEMPELDAFDRESEEVRVIGLAFEETSEEDLRAFLRTRPVSYPIALVDPYAPPAGWDAPRGLPLSVLIDPEGRRVRTFLGPVTAAELRSAMEAADD
ncbi:MAG: hypothetical protein KatS3mg126_1027 [Lysobacteraceae bacterium]|nr:MAG: hypothetical protein KatS3mg126_1027 [Xanthomonadaceae bacterium]